MTYMVISDLDGPSNRQGSRGRISRLKDLWTGMGIPSFDETGLRTIMGFDPSLLEGV